MNKASGMHILNYWAKFTPKL